MHGTSRPCLQGTVERTTHECCQVGRANNSNAFGLFFEQESQSYLTFTMIRTPSSYGGARGDLSSILMGALKCGDSQDRNFFWIELNGSGWTYYRKEYFVRKTKIKTKTNFIFFYHIQNHPQHVLYHSTVPSRLIVND